MGNLASLLSDAYDATCEWQHSVMYMHDEQYHLAIDMCEKEMHLRLKKLKEHLNNMQDL
jgi:negative regulator of genetic competence, sporulation and motility